VQGGRGGPALTMQVVHERARCVAKWINMLMIHDTPEKSRNAQDKMTFLALLLPHIGLAIVWRSSIYGKQ
jgi:hypothetical protein